jgi:hypothetical protein
MKTEAVPTRRRFYNEWDEIEYLRQKILYWFYGKANRRKALPLCARLQALLKRTPGARGAILAEECRSLICEVQGDLPKAIAHREREIAMMKRLIQISDKGPNRDYVLDGRDYPDLSDRHDLLAILYHDAGDLAKAIHVLKESRRLCQRHGIPFDGDDLLRDYLAEARANGHAPHSAARKK